MLDLHPIPKGALVAKRYPKPPHPLRMRWTHHSIYCGTSTCEVVEIIAIISPFQIVGHFGKSICIIFTMHLDIVFIHVYNKIYVSRFAKTTYNLERRVDGNKSWFLTRINLQLGGLDACCVGSRCHSRMQLGWEYRNWQMRLYIGFAYISDPLDSWLSN